MTLENPVRIASNIMVDTATLGPGQGRNHIVFADPPKPALSRECQRWVMEKYSYNPLCVTEDWIDELVRVAQLPKYAEAAEKLNQDGNEAFAEQAYLEALELYQSAQVESPELAEPYFNAANTFYRQGDFPAALEQMQMALQYVDEESLAESSYYNLGNTLFNSQELETAVAKS